MILYQIICLRFNTGPEILCSAIKLCIVYIHTDGSVGWKKEIWHTGGYTDERASHVVTEPLLDKWIGWKVIVYNIEIGNDATVVKLESYIDHSNSNEWTKVTELIDSGGGYAIVTMIM